jgi:hypothetical protein
MRLRRNGCTLLAAELKVLDNARGRITSSTVDPRGASCRGRLLRHRQGVRRARWQPSSMATGGVDAQRLAIRGAYLVRTLQTAQLNSLDCVARSTGSRDWSNRSCTRRDDSFSVHWITATPSLAARPCSLAGRHRCSRVPCCPRGGSSPLSSSAEGWLRVIAPALPAILFAPSQY